MIRRLLKYRGFGINFLAGCCFITLAVYGWGLGWSELRGYLLLIFVCMICLIIVAAFLGFLLRKALAKK